LKKGSDPLATHKIFMAQHVSRGLTPFSTG
jgi:hypothetical protein